MCSRDDVQQSNGDFKALPVGHLQHITALTTAAASAAAVIDHFTAISSKILPDGYCDTIDAKTLISHVDVHHHSTRSTFAVSKS
jgi:hypothetical protein